MPGLHSSKVQNRPHFDDMSRPKRGGRRKNEGVIGFAERDRRNPCYLLGLAVYAVVFFTFTTVSYANKMNSKDLAKKAEGRYFTGLPLMNYTSDTGLGYGVRVYLYDNGERSEPHFDSTPYLVRTYVQFFQTTNGQAYHDLNLDIPYFLQTRWRLKSETVYKYALNANYFGIGARTADAGLIDSSGVRYSTHEDYRSFLDSGTDDASLVKYNKYQYRMLSTRWIGSREVTDWFEFIIGFNVGKVEIEDWAGKSIDEGDLQATSAETLLTRDADTLRGITGGWTNLAILGLRLDWLDFEPNPKLGLLGEYLLELSTTLIGSDFDYARQTFSVRGFYTLWDRLTVGARTAITYSSEGTPFFEMAAMTFFSGRASALGGVRTGRGLISSRHIAQGITLGQMELRYFVGDVVIGGQRLGLQPTAFVDTGNVYDSFGDIFTKPRYGQYKVSYGGGVVIPWNLSTLIHVFMGYNAEGANLSINFNNAF
jgi:hypothetical protein